MPAVLLGALALILLLWALNAFTKTDPKITARILKIAGGIALLAGALALAFFERFALALPLGIAGLALLGLWPGGFGIVEPVHLASGEGRPIGRHLLHGQPAAGGSLRYARLSPWQSRPSR